MRSLLQPYMRLASETLASPASTFAACRRSMTETLRRRTGFLSQALAIAALATHQVLSSRFPDW
jgi:hypothetical protein